MMCIPVPLIPHKCVQACSLQVLASIQTLANSWGSDGPSRLGRSCAQLLFNGKLCSQ
jgi:hypothetical protein